MQTRVPTHRIKGEARQKSALDWWVKQDEVQPLPKVQGLRPQRQEEGRNTPDQSEEGAAVMAGDVGTTAVGSGGESAGWLRRSGLAKVQHHGL